jgi:hypothetical protein
MTKFADQLLDDLMREHGTALAHAAPSAPRARHAVAGRKLLVAGAGGAAVAAAAAGVLVAGGGTPAYAVTAHPDGTVTLAVSRAAGISGANGALQKLGDRVVVVPVEPGCPSLPSLRPPVVPVTGHLPVQTTVGIGGSAGSAGSAGSVTVNAKGIPAGDVLVVGVETSTTGITHSSMGGARLTSPPAPGCVNLPAQGAPPAG